jgi:uncharacterized membrane protein YczE
VKLQKPFNRAVFSRILLSIFGIFLIGFGGALIRYSGFGTDPYSGMNLGVSQTVGIMYGTWQFIFNGIILVWMFFVDRTKIGFGTLISMSCIGYLSDFSLFVLTALLGEGALYLRIFSLLAAILAVCFGIVIYIDAKLGIAPYDALSLIISEKLKKPQWFKWCRLGTDLVCVITAFIFHGPLGIGTVIMALFTGPLMTLIRKARLFQQN